MDLTVATIDSPYEVIEVPLVERVRQAAELSEALRKIGSGATEAG